MGGLSHLDDDGDARMVDVGDKPTTERTARATATVRMTPDTARRVAAGDLPKGDLRAVVRLAGIQAAKRTSELIPLCHQVSLTRVDVEFDLEVETGEARITAEARAADRTGVEMEALVAASTAALTLYDMVKAVQRDVVIADLRLLSKSGGQSGEYHSPA
ncbi:MAG: cyclic pyranopterin monophosphate synthase MoaC [Nitriliruptorales bacterium]|nr:cyclic pyranopterin monophosphate synthase MoaC [Nitriliruptorales bacterium]